MTHHIEQTIATLQEQLRKHLDAARDTKRVINHLCRTAGRDPLFPDADQQQSVGSPISIRRDQWYGQPLATAIREYLNMRRSTGQGPATVHEIHAALSSGGFQFEAKDDENAKRGIRISLTKNTVIFHRLPNGNTFGLAEWYPNARRERCPDEKEASSAPVADSNVKDGAV